MDKIIFVTSNQGKVKSAQKYFDDLELDYYKYDLIEPRSESLEEIAEYKVLQAYEQLKTPCIAVDAGFYIEPLNNWPSSFVNFNLEKLGIEGILKLLEKTEDRKAYFKECLAYYDGKDIKFFYGVSKGTVARSASVKNCPEQWSVLWKIFVPLNSTKTMSDMTEEERNNRNDGHTSCFKEFNDYLRSKRLVLK